MNVYVFLGPTLSHREAAAELDATYLPPVRQGDVYRATLKKAHAIGIIDGYFDHVPSVWHKEILWAMSQGVHVYGSSSMGALRAAELESFGMQGVGNIFAAYRDGRLTDDDEVAVVHGPGEIGFPQLSEPMVNIRFTLERAEREGIITYESRFKLERFAKSLFYPERSYKTLLLHASNLSIDRSEIRTLSSWLTENCVDQKREDAVALLRKLREDIERDAGPKKVFFKLERTIFWENFIERTDSQNAEPGSNSTTEESVLDELRLDSVAYKRVCHAALARHLMAAELRGRGWNVDENEVEQAKSLIRHRHKLDDQAAFEQWLAEVHLTREQFDRLMYEEIALINGLNALARKGPARIIDELRLNGDYTELLRRASDKDRVLQSRDLDNPQLKDIGMTVQELVDWYFRQQLPPEQNNFPSYVAIDEFVRVDAAGFLRALLREFCYQQSLQESINPPRQSSSLYPQ